MPPASASARTSAACRGARGGGARQNAKFGPAPVWNGGEPAEVRLRPPGEAEASARKKLEEADDTAADDMAAAGSVVDRSGRKLVQWGRAAGAARERNARGGQVGSGRVATGE